MREIQRIVLIGFSGGGKSTVARGVADRLGWTGVDIDEAIVAEFCKSIPEIFAEHGESRFRAVERRLLAEAIQRDRVVIATGGGAVVDSDAWGPELLRRAGTLVIALDVSSEVTFDRLTEQQANEGGAVERPLLAGDNPLERIESLKAERQAAYDQADLSLAVNNMAPEEVVEEILSIVAPDDSRPALTLQTQSGHSSMYIRPGIAMHLGRLIKDRWPNARSVWVITEERVAGFHLELTLDAVRSVGYQAEGFTVPPGESSKSLETANALYDWLLGGGIERGDVIVALGGGVIGDLAGFVAATCLRGVGLVQLPTSLLAMVDSSVGGKTGINHRTGKNLIGAFYQPPLVIIDSTFLETLPRRELVSGWAEVIKHGVIQRSTPGGAWNDLSAILDRSAGQLQALREPALSYVIERNVQLKAAVVAADERETGIRAYLNFGHTLGHAIEAAGYRHLHGEAVAVGMRAASRIGVDVGSCQESDVESLDVRLSRYGLPERAHVDSTQALALVSRDKKRVAGTQRWVLPLSGGGVEIRTDVPQSVVERALAAVTEATSTEPT